MAIDLTRFDFHVVRFMNSEHVDRMSDTEVGQFVLLLCKAWAQGKDATLPDDMEYLARHARCQTISQKVLEEFPVVETPWGLRRRNKTLYGEWIAAQERSNSASERGKKGNESRYGNADSLAIATPLLRPYTHANGEKKTSPNQIIPNQSNQTNHTNSSQDPGNFGQVKTQWWALFKKKLSSSKQNRQQYADACYKYSEEKVLTYLEEWAKINDWVSVHPRGENRLYVFLQDLPTMVRGDEIRAEKVVRKVDLSAEPPEITEQKRVAAEEDRVRDAELEKQKRIEKENWNVPF